MCLSEYHENKNLGISVKKKKIPETLYVEICKDIRSSEYYRGLATEGKNN